MPTGKMHQTMYIRGGNPDAINDATPSQPGLVGGKWIDNGVQRQYVKLDSGATSATPSGVVAANQIAYWKDRDLYLVTNDLRFAQEGRDGVAGIFTYAATAGYCTAIKNGRSKKVNVKVDGSSFVAGDKVIANSGTSCDGTRVAAGTADTYKRIGVARGAASANVLVADLELPDYD